MYHVELCEAMEGGIFTEKLAPLIMCAVIALIAFGLMKLALKISSSVTKRKSFHILVPLSTPLPLIFAPASEKETFFPECGFPASTGSAEKCIRRSAT